VEARSNDGRISSATTCGTIVTPPTGFSWNPPVAPATCSISRNADGSVQVNWSADSSAAFYVVRRNGGWNGRVNSPNTAYTDGRTAAGTSYTYTVESRSDQGISARTPCGAIVA